MFLRSKFDAYDDFLTIRIRVSLPLKKRVSRINEWE